jgi:hypothetical protein
VKDPLSSSSDDEKVAKHAKTPMFLKEYAQIRDNEMYNSFLEKRQQIQN